MKQKLLFAPALLCTVVLMVFLAGCARDKFTHTYQIRKPIYETLASFRKKVQAVSPQPIVNTGKIAKQGQYIFISEPYKGIHVIDNTNPKSPQNISFINIPGNEDMAIAGNTLYADAYADLVSFDITDPAHVVAKSFAAGVFPDHSIYYYNGGGINPDSINVIVGWETKDTTVDYNPQNAYPNIYYGCASCETIAPVLALSSSGSKATNGSLSRFAIVNNHLYTVSFSDLSTFNIQNKYAPALTNTQTVDFHVETIFPFKNYLFVGTNNGMYMYNVATQPDVPTKLGAFLHARGCDPVIADDDHAYVTINDLSACLGFNNDLEILDIKDPTQASLVKTYQLTHPIGLSKDGNTLFICDSRDGLKVYNATDVSNLQLIAQLKDDEVYDVIAENGIAILVGKSGLLEYDYTDLANIHLISKL